MGFQRTRSGREHGNVADILRSVDFDLTASLAFLRGLRNAADYDMDLGVATLARQCQNARLRAEAIISRLDTLADRDNTNPSSN